MIQTVNRRLFVLVAAALVAAVATSAAVAAPGHGKFGHRMTARGAAFAGPQMGGFGLGGPGVRRLRRPGRPGVAGPGLAGPGMRGPGDRGGPGGGAVLSADVLTPAASFLGVSVSTLTADLKGGKTLAQEATAKGKTADDLIAAIVAAQKTVFDAENAAGWITDAQETALLADFKAGVTKLVNVGPPVPPAKKPGLLDDGRDLHRDQRLGSPGRTEGRQVARADRDGQRQDRRRPRHGAHRAGEDEPRRRGDRRHDHGGAGADASLGSDGKGHRHREQHEADDLDQDEADDGALQALARQLDRQEKESAPLAGRFLVPGSVRAGASAASVSGPLSWW